MFAKTATQKECTPKARRGEIKGFTGIDDAYENPESAEITLETVNRTADENARFVIEHLRSKGFLAPRGQAAKISF